MDDLTRGEILGRLDDLWKVQPQPLTSGLPMLGQAKELANSLARWYVQTIVEQQNAFNAAVVQAIQALAANDDRRHTELVAQIHLMNGQLNAALRRMEQIERHLADVDDAETALATALVELRHDLVAPDGEPGT